MTKSITYHGFCEQLCFKNTSFASLVKYGECGCQNYFLTNFFILLKMFHILGTTGQISLLEGAIAHFGISGNTKGNFFFFFLNSGFSLQESIFKMAEFIAFSMCKIMTKLSGFYFKENKRKMKNCHY